MLAGHQLMLSFCYIYVIHKWILSAVHTRTIFISLAAMSCSLLYKIQIYFCFSDLGLSKDCHAPYFICENMGKFWVSILPPAVFTTHPSTAPRNHIGIQGICRRQSRKHMGCVYYWFRCPTWYNVDKKPQICAQILSPGTSQSTFPPQSAFSHHHLSKASFKQPKWTLPEKPQCERFSSA